MARQRIQGGAMLDIPSVDEIGTDTAARLAAFGAQQRLIADERERQHARGIKNIRRDVQITAATTRFTNLDGIGPELGYVWGVRLLSAQLASAGTMQAWITSDTSTGTTAANSRRLVMSNASNQFQVALFNSGACILLPDEGLFLSAGQNITSYFLAAWEVPAEMAWKLM